MEDDTNSDSEAEKFTVEYSASELYHLHALLQYHSIERDFEMSVLAGALAKRAHDKMCTEEFSEAMDEELDEALEMQQQNTHNPLDDIQGGTFQ